MTMATPDAPRLAAVSDSTFLTDLAEHLTVPARAEEFMGLVEHMGKAATLLLEFLGSYIASETSPHTIFREDSLATRLLGATVFLSTNTQFLRLTVLPLVMTIRANPKQYLLDASRGASKSTAQLNALRSTIATFLTAVATNITYCSASLRFVLASVEDLVQKKFPSHSVLSSLFFLRFLCPAIVRCETIFVELGQMDTDERRAVVLVTKVLQSIANGVDMKETLYSPLNTFVHEQHTAVASLCVKLIDANSFQVSCLEQLGSRRTTLVSPYPEPSSETLRFVTPFISQSDISVVHPLLWSCDDVQTWLDRSSLVDCKAVCAKYKVNGSMLVLLPDPGLPEVKLHKAQRKQLTAAVQALLTERTRFFPAYKAPEKWTTNEVLDYLSFMDLSAFSFTIRTLSTKVAFPGTSLLRLRDDDMRVLGVDGEKDRQAILDRVMDGSFVQHRMDSHSDTRRRASAPSWIERRVRHSASAENEQTAGDLD